MIRKKKGGVELDEKRDGESFCLKNMGKCGSWVELVRLSSFECGMTLVKWEHKVKGGIYPILCSAQGN